MSFAAEAKETEKVTIDQMIGMLDRLIRQTAEERVRLDEEIRKLTEVRDKWLNRRASLSR